MVMTGSGSGGYSMELSPFSEEHHLEVLQNEEPGQLYAYRYNNTKVVLGSRKKEIFGAAVGVSMNSKGKYKCVAINDYEREEFDLEIGIKSESQS